MGNGGALFLLSILLFGMGLATVFLRRSAVLALIGIELMLNAANLNFLLFWRAVEGTKGIEGLLFVLFSIGIAAAEAAVGLALILAIHRHYRTIAIDELKRLRG